MQDGWLLTLTCCGWETIERRRMTYEELFQYYLVTGARGAPKSPVREQLEESRRPYGAEDTTPKESRFVQLIRADRGRVLIEWAGLGCDPSIQRARVGTVFSR
ncbi:hypothetical protein CFAM422_004155 [Trichoderma lentiforme]|uniref:Uncharacterized protein n=1 Tax=Trichoderma lentiforme TaxID=1567552 RepID=A0A9P5CDG1_9HYPO|nr:hypothetical protein CFAM422_004155 [Trichoderma lentiforme]